MGLFQKLQGVINSFFQIGGPSGPGWNDNAGTLEAKDSTNTVFAAVSVATPVGNNNAVTKAYEDTSFKPIFSGSPWNGGVALPANTLVEHFYVVTTTGAFAVIGDLLWDDGSGVGTVHVIAAPTGGTFLATAAMGGAINFTQGVEYWWNGAAWAALTSAIAIGTMLCIEISVGLVNQASVTSIPLGAIIYRCDVEIDTPYSPGATIEVGQAGTPAAFQAPADNDPQVAGTYTALQRTPALVNGVLEVTVAGAPVAGTAIVSVIYAQSVLP